METSAELDAAKAYVQAVISARFPKLDGLEREEVLGDGLELYVRGLRGRRLGDRLIDRWRARHPGSRSASGPAPPAEPLPDSLSEELIEESFERRLESYRAALIFCGEADFGDPRLMGKLIGGVVPSSQRAGAWDSVLREREKFGQIFGFGFYADDEVL